MPNIKSAKKRVLVIETKTLQNKMFKSQLKTDIKKYYAALEAGAADVISEEVGCFEIYTEPADLESVRDALASAGFPIQSAELEKVPSSYTALTDEEDIKMMELLLEKLEDDDDVQNVWHNWEQ